MSTVGSIGRQQQIAEIHVQAPVVGTCVFENGDAALDVEPCDPACLGEELRKVCLHVVDSQKARVHGLALLQLHA